MVVTHKYSDYFFPIKIPSHNVRKFSGEKAKKTKICNGKMTAGNGCITVILKKNINNQAI